MVNCFSRDYGAENIHLAFTEKSLLIPGLKQTSPACFSVRETSSHPLSTWRQRLVREQHMGAACSSVSITGTAGSRKC